MVDSIENRGQQDRIRVDRKDRHEIDKLQKRFNISQQEAEKAGEQFDPFRDDIEKGLGKGMGK
jgi:hypothetical protein